jgi:hypothetical protein
LISGISFIRKNRPGSLKRYSVLKINVIKLFLQKLEPMKKTLFVLFLFLLFQQLITGQKAPIKFGDVSLEELKMVSYPEDTSASAVILCDYGYLNTTSLIFTRVLRIKILKTEGYSWANNTFPINEKSAIKGVTTNLENGKIVQEKLKNESIFTVKVTEDSYNTRIAMPAVRVGSVIDIQFYFTGIPNEWKFQEVIPVKYSELILENTPNIRFKYNFFGYQPLATISPTRWVGKNMPAFKVEPYMTSKENYLTKLEFDILDISAPGYYQEYSTSWKAISKLLMENENFGNTLSGSLYLNSVANSLESAKLTDEDLLRKAFESVKSVVKWDEKSALLASNSSLGFIYKMKIGNSADINLILYQLLKKLKFDVKLVMMSTRENGILSFLSPSAQKLNYVIVLTETGDKSYLLDATDTYRPYYLVPFRCLNGNGLTVDANNSEMVDLVTVAKEQEHTTYNLTLQDDYSLKGDLSIKKIDYSALNFRQDYHKFNSTDEYLEDFRKDKPGLVINESVIDNIDSIYLPTEEHYKITVNNQLNTIGDEIYILPLLYNQMKDNPFKMEVRQYPVDYGYAIEKTITSIYDIPENYEIAAVPLTFKYNLPGNGASYVYEVIRNGNKVSISSTFSINKTIFLQAEYKSLKEFYNKVIKKQAEPIILKRK